MIEPKAIISAISDKLTTAVPALKKVAPIAEFLKLKIEQYALICPSVFVAYRGSKYSPIGNGYVLRDMEFYLLVCGRSYVSTTKLLVGSETKDGILDVIEDVRSALTYYDFSDVEPSGLDLRPLEPIEDQEVDGDELFAVYGLVFRTAQKAKES